MSIDRDHESGTQKVSTSGRFHAFSSFTHDSCPSLRHSNSGENLNENQLSVDAVQEPSGR